MRLTQRPKMLKTILAQHARVKRKIFVGCNGIRHDERYLYILHSQGSPKLLLTGVNTQISSAFDPCIPREAGISGCAVSEKSALQKS